MTALFKEWALGKSDAISFRNRLTMLFSGFSWSIAAAAALPILCFAAYVTVTVVADTRSALEQSYRAMARVLLSAIDAELNAELRTLQGLATTPALQAGDWATFHDQARTFAAAHGDWPVVAVTDAEARRQLLNTAIASTAEPRPVLEPDSVLEVVRTGQPKIGRILARGMVWPTPIMVLRVPVFRNNQVALVLAAAVSPASIAAILKNQKPSEGTLITVYDRHLNIVASSTDDPNLVAQPASASTRRQATAGKDGLFLDVAPDGREYRQVMVISKKIGWSVTVGVRREAFDAVLTERAQELAVGAALAMLIAGFGVMLLGHRFGRLMATAERRVAETLRVANHDLENAREQALERAKEAQRLQADIETVMNAVPAVVLIARDRHCRSIVGNVFAERYFGVSRLDNLSLSAEKNQRVASFRVFRDGMELNTRNLPMQTAARGTEVRDWQSEIVFADGTVKTLIGNASPLRTPDGAVYGAVGAFLDATERKQLEAALRAQKDMLQLFVEGAPAGIAMLDNDLHYLAVSRRFVDDYRLGTYDLVGRNHFDVFPEVPDHWRAILRRCLAGETLRCEEEPFPRADGRLDWVRWEIRPWFAAPTRIGGIILFAENITEQKAANADLRAAKLAAEEANAEKTRFLAALSHDLRQPMMAQRLLLHVAASRAECPEQADLLAKVGDALENAEGMLSRLMDLAALELGKVSVKRQVLSLDALLSNIVNETSAAADGKGLLIKLWVQSCWTDSDPVLLGRIVRNLVINAIKYTDYGWILVAIRRRRDHLRIEVRDSGRGISADQQHLIFEEFHQLENAERCPTKGQGLGLAIASRTADLLGHRLSLRSAPGRGSVFALQVPLVAGPNHHPPDAHQPAGGTGPADPTPSRPAHILVIENDPIQAKALEMVLTDCGYRVSVADSAVSPATFLVAPFDLIISDYRLPGAASGLEGIETIRRIGGWRIPALLLTGDAQPAAAAAAGCDFLLKPCPPSTILNTVRRLIEALPSAPGLAKPPPNPAADPTPDGFQDAPERHGH